MASLWLSHHHQAQWDRCLRLGQLRICRRCLLLWPLTYALLLAQILLRAPAAWGGDLLLPLLLAPPVIEYLGVHAAGWTYRPWRIWLLTPLLAAAVARLLFRHMARPFDPWAWSLLGLTGLACGWAAWRHQRGA